MSASTNGGYAIDIYSVITFSVFMCEEVKSVLDVMSSQEEKFRLTVRDPKITHERKKRERREPNLDHVHAVQEDFRICNV